MRVNREVSLPLRVSMLFLFLSQLTRNPKGAFLQEQTYSDRFGQFSAKSVKKFQRFKFELVRPLEFSKKMCRVLYMVFKCAKTMLVQGVI